MLANPGAVDPVPSPAREALPGARRPAPSPSARTTSGPAAFLRALGHCGKRGLLVGAACAVATAVACWLALPPEVPVVAARLRLVRPAPETIDPAAPRRELAALVKDPATLAAALGQPGVADLPVVREQDPAAEWLGAALEVQAPPGGDAVVLSLRGRRADDLAAVVNAVAEATTGDMNARQRRAAAARLDAAEAACRAARERLQGPRGRLRELTAAVGAADVANLAVKQRLALEKLGDAEKQLRQVRSSRAAAEVELAGLRAREPAAPAPPGLDEQLAADEDWVRLHELRAKIVADIDKLEALAQPGKVPPKLADYRDSLANVEREIREHRERVRKRLLANRPAAPAGDAAVPQLEKQVAAWSEAEGRLAAEVRRLEAEDRALSAARAGAERLGEEAAAAEAALRGAEAEARAREEEARALPRVVLEERAEAPPAAGPRRAATSALAAACGFAVVLLGRGWREYRARRVRSAGDVTGVPGLRLFGTLPAAARAVRRRLAGATPSAKDPSQRRLTEAADAARTQLLHEMEGHGLRSVLITSAAGAEGKTSLAVLLAVSLARAWRRTLLIDASLRGPALHRVFGLPPEPGLAEVLRGEAEMDHVVRSTPVSRLWALPAGRLDDHALQALAQDDVGPMLDELKRQYDFVVIDAGPVLPVADALILARHVDAALLAVLCGASRRPQVEAARARLEALGVRVLGAVVAGAPADPAATG